MHAFAENTTLYMKFTDIIHSTWLIQVHQL